MNLISKYGTKIFVIRFNLQYNLMKKQGKNLMANNNQFIKFEYQLKKLIKIQT